MDDSPGVGDAADIARAQRVFEDALNIDAPAPDVDIVETGLIDSLGLVTLLFELEREFGVQSSTRHARSGQLPLDCEHRAHGRRPQVRGFGVSEVRPLKNEEVGQIAELYRFVDNSDWRIPPAEVPAWFERTLFADPWADPEIPTLVHVESSGEITAFIASHVRRMRFDGRVVRLAAGGPLIVHPKARNQAVGPRLWRRYLDGPQELTTTDGASDEMRQIFELIGGHMLHPSSMAWAPGVCALQLHG